MSNLKNISGYSISAATALAAIAISVDRYGEFAAGAESFASWVIPPVFLVAMAVTALVAIKLGHPNEGDQHA